MVCLFAAARVLFASRRLRHSSFAPEMETDRPSSLQARSARSYSDGHARGTNTDTTSRLGVGRPISPHSILALLRAINASASTTPNNTPTLKPKDSMSQEDKRQSTPGPALGKGKSGASRAPLNNSTRAAAGGGSDASAIRIVVESSARSQATERKQMQAHEHQGVRLEQLERKTSAAIGQFRQIGAGSCPTRAARS